MSKTAATAAIMVEAGLKPAPTPPGGGRDRVEFIRPPIARLRELGYLTFRGGMCVWTIDWFGG